MRNLFIVILLPVATLTFAKTKIDFRLVPKDANVVGYLASKELMTHKFFKDALNNKDAVESLAALKDMGLDYKKVGSIVFYANTDTLKKENVKDSDSVYAIIFNGLSLEKLLLNELKKNKQEAKTINYKGYKIYIELKIKEDKFKNKADFEAVTFIDSSTVTGSLKGVKKVIDAKKGNNFNPSLINKVSAELKNPQFLFYNALSKKQKLFMDESFKKQKDGMVASLGLDKLNKSAKILVFAGNLKGDVLKLTLAVQASPKDVKTFATSLNSQFQAFKPMLKQQIMVYGAMLGQDAIKELSSILDSIKIFSKGKYAMISLKINMKNTVEIINKYTEQQKMMNQFKQK